MLSAEVEAREAWGGFLEHPDIPYHKQAHSSEKKILTPSYGDCQLFAMYLLSVFYYFGS